MDSRAFLFLSSLVSSFASELDGKVLELAYFITYFLSWVTISVSKKLKMGFLVMATMAVKSRASNASLS